jgi:signal transduction histidine kinase
MLDISRVQSGKLSFLKEEFELREMVQDVLTRISAQIESHRSQVIFVPGPEVRGSWDRFRIEQVFINLLTNALKYGEGRPIEIRLAIDADRAKLSVTDRGIGIAKTDFLRIFGQFERAVSSNNISGLGLGLYISKKIIEAHAGKISIQSEVGKGSTFTMELPLLRSL